MTGIELYFGSAPSKGLVVGIITKQLPYTWVCLEEANGKDAEQIICLLVLPQPPFNPSNAHPNATRSIWRPWVSSCSHSSGLEQFQMPHPLPGNCPCAFPLRLAQSHSSTNRSGEQAWPEPKQIWQFFSLWNSPGSHNSWFPSRSWASWKVPPTLSNLGTSKGAKQLQLMHSLSTKHHYFMLLIKTLARSPIECNSLRERAEPHSVHTVSYSQLLCTQDHIWVV